MKSMMTIVLGLAATGVLGAETIRLPAPDNDSGVTVMQALKARHSGYSSTLGARLKTSS